MTNLKNVYGIISFEETNIKISVFLVCKQKQHCMYHRNIILPESLSDFLKNNRNDLIQYLQKELIKVDNFIGIKVLRYLILVPHLNMTVSNHLTDELNCANQEELNKYLNNIIIPENKVCLSHVITDYVVNEQVQLHFPQKQKFKANYIEYLADKNDIKDICELISSLCIEPLGFYNNAIAYQASLLNHEKKTRMLIDMQDDLSNVYLYDKNADLYCLKTIIRGKN